MKLSYEDVFTHAFVVSIDEVRYQAFVDNFKKAGIETIPKLWNGMYVSDKYIDIYRRGDPRMMTNCTVIKQICNACGQYFIVVMAKVFDWPFVTIFEDDAVPVEGIKEKLDLYLSNIPDDIDAIRLGYLDGKPPSKAPIFEFDHISSEFRYGSHAYIVFKKYYDKFLQASHDSPYADFERLHYTEESKVYVLKKSLFNQKNIPGRDVIHSIK
jgi:hypothetical protein